MIQVEIQDMAVGIDNRGLPIRYYGGIHLILLHRNDSVHAGEAGGRFLAWGRGAVVCEAARALMAAGYNPAERLEAWRGPTLCLSGQLGAFAGLNGAGRYLTRHALLCPLPPPPH